MGKTEALNLIKSANSIALFCHVNPDCDTICSALALQAALEKKGKTTHIFCDGEPIPKIDVCGVARVNSDKPLSKYDLSIAVDCGDENRVGKYINLYNKSCKTLCVDHHLQSARFADVNYVEPSSGATAELVYLLIVSLDSTLMDTSIATLLYTALVTDTGNFSFSCTGNRTLAIASELLSFGIDNAAISYKHFKSISLPVFRLKARALPKTHFFEDNQIGIITFLKDDFEATGTSSADSSNLVNEIINISSVKIAASVTEVKPHSFKISVRTSEGINASSIASTFGGGGHHAAAGFMLNGFIGNVIDDILKVCRDYL